MMTNFILATICPTLRLSSPTLRLILYSQERLSASHPIRAANAITTVMIRCFIYPIRSAANQGLNGLKPVAVVRLI
jgi:hypothetical protein